MDPPPAAGRTKWGWPREIKQHPQRPLASPLREEEAGYCRTPKRKREIGYHGLAAALRQMLRAHNDVLAGK